MEHNKQFIDVNIYEELLKERFDMFSTIRKNRLNSTTILYYFNFKDVSITHIKELSRVLISKFNIVKSRDYWLMPDLKNRNVIEESNDIHKNVSVYEKLLRMYFDMSSDIRKNKLNGASILYYLKFGHISKEKIIELEKILLFKLNIKREENMWLMPDRNE